MTANGPETRVTGLTSGSSRTSDRGSRREEPHRHTQEWTNGPSTTSGFRVRRYECDRYGHLNNAQYLRYVDALDEDLPPPPGAAARLRIEFLQAPEAGAVLEASASINRSAADGERRRYTFRQRSREVAHAEVEWQTLDGSASLHVPPAPPPPAGVLRYRRAVEWRDVGTTGTVPPYGLAALAEDAGVRVCAVFGWPMTRCAEHGLGILLRRHEVEIGAPLGLDDEVELETWASGPRRATALRHYRLTRVRDGALAARFRSLYVWVKLESGRPTRIPPDFLSSFRSNFVDESAAAQP